MNFNLLAAEEGLNGSLAEIVNKLKGLMDSFWLYIVLALAAVVVIWGAYIGIKIAIAHRNEEKINARDMVKNLIIGIVFQISNTTKISNAIFNACVGDWINGYNINKIDVTSLSVGDIFGGYNAALFGIWPTSWKCNGMVNPNNFMYLPALIAGIALGIALIIAILNLAKRVYEIIYLYFCMPVSMSTLPLDDGARFKNWREQFLTKIILAYGAVLSVNVFVLLLPLIQQMSISGASGFANSIFLIFMIVGGAMVIPAGQTLFARLFGTADDMHAGGGWLRSAYYGGRVVGAMTVGLAVKGVKGIYHAVRRNKHSNNDSGSSGDSSSSDGGDDEKYTDDGSADTSATEGGGE